MDSRTQLFIDFDDSLSDNRKVREHVATVLSEVGFSPEEAQERLQTLPRTDYFSLQRYLDHAQATPSQQALFMSKWLEELPKFGYFLFEGAVEFLESIDRERYIPILLTLGNPEWQEQKVRASGLHDYFERHHYVETKKYQALLDIGIRPDDFFLLIDDRDDCRLEMQATFPRAVCYAAFEEARATVCR